MKCIHCGNKTTFITNTRVIYESTVVKRRRECPNCHKRFTTYETIADDNND